MKRDVLLVLVLLILLSGVSLILPWTDTTGRIVSDTEVPTIGPSLEEQACMKPCVSQGCNENDMECKMKNSAKCLEQCNMQKPDQTPEEQCVEQCAMEGCDEFDFSCQSKNQEKCDKQCGMIKEPEAKSEEEQCIMDCVKKADPSLICQAAEGGEQGDEVCQRCAQECVYLYKGPCLNDEKLKTKQKECETCKHCYGEPVMGDSGEGYECIVDMKCNDASSEFGDDSGTGEGIAEKLGDTIGNAMEGIFNFFRGLFNNKAEEPASPGQTENP